MPRTPGLEELRAEARYRREQRDLYRARVYGGRSANVNRLRELERRVVSAEGILARALERSRDHSKAAGLPRRR